MNGWFLLIAAIVLEVAGTTSMKLSSGMSKLWPSILMFVFYFSCFGVFSLALKRLEASTAYAIWSGLGTALITGIGILWFQESFSIAKLISIILIIAGVVGLNFSGNIH